MLITGSNMYRLLVSFVGLLCVIAVVLSSDYERCSDFSYGLKKCFEYYDQHRYCCKDLEIEYNETESEEARERVEQGNFYQECLNSNHDYSDEMDKTGCSHMELCMADKYGMLTENGIIDLTASKKYFITIFKRSYKTEIFENILKYCLDRDLSIYTVGHKINYDPYGMYQSEREYRTISQEWQDNQNHRGPHSYEWKHPRSHERRDSPSYEWKDPGSHERRDPSSSEWVDTRSHGHKGPPSYEWEDPRSSEQEDHHYEDQPSREETDFHSREDDWNSRHQENWKNKKYLSTPLCYFENLNLCINMQQFLSCQDWDDDSNCNGAETKSKECAILFSE